MGISMYICENNQCASVMMSIINLHCFSCSDVCFTQILAVAVFIFKQITLLLALLSATADVVNV